MQADLEKLTTVTDEVASSFGLHVLELKLTQQGKRRALEITLYRPGGRISLNDCEHVSRKLEEVLDQQDPPLIDSSFLLEVQSPGIDRKLSNEREFEIFSGEPVEVKTKQKVNGLGSAFTGKLVGLSEGRVLISQAKKISDSPQSKRKSAKTEASSAESLSDPVAVEVSNLIHVRLNPEPPKASDAAVDLN